MKREMKEGGVGAPRERLLLDLVDDLGIVQCQGLNGFQVGTLSLCYILFMLFMYKF